jgi:hypothetical protein
LAIRRLRHTNDPPRSFIEWRAAIAPFRSIDMLWGGSSKDAPRVPSSIVHAQRRHHCGRM